MGVSTLFVKRKKKNFHIAHVRLIRNTTFIEEMLFSKLLTAFPLPFEISRVWNYLPTVNNWKIYPQKGRNYTCKLKKIDNAGLWSLIESEPTKLSFIILPAFLPEKNSGSLQRE